MTLACLLAAPTLVRTGAGTLVVARLRLADVALLLSACADATGRAPDDAVDEPSFADAMDWLFGAGLPTFLWLALRCDRPGLTPDDAADLAGRLSVAEVGSIYDAALRRSAEGVPAAGEGVDVARIGWPKIVCRMAAEYHALPSELAGLTLDQVHCLQTGGEEPGLSASEVQRMWEAARAADPPGVGPEVEPARPMTAAEELAAMGLEIVPEAGPEVMGG